MTVSPGYAGGMPAPEVAANAMPAGESFPDSGDVACVPLDRDDAVAVASLRLGELRQMPPGDVHRIVTAREVRLHAAAFPVAAGMAVDRASIRDGDLETVAHRHRLADQVGGAGAAAADHHGAALGLQRVG